MKKIFTFLIFISSILIAQGTDIANNYGGTWVSGSNMGTGFSVWGLATSGSTGSAGHFISDAAADGFGNMDGTTADFGMYGNGGDMYAVSARDFASPLTNGQTFSIDLAIAYRNGNKGINLQTSSTTDFTFQVSSDTYLANGNPLAWSYSQTSIFTIEVTQTSATEIEVRITRGSDVYNSGIITTSERLSKFTLFIGETGSNALDNLYINNLEIRDSSPVPVQLTSFTANIVGDNTELSWTTATEVNNYGFEIESSNNETNWNNIGFVEGHGNSNSPKDYSFVATDNSKYYRLKQVDIDGVFE